MNDITFIGLGKMGTPMALNLLKKKFNLTIFDLNLKHYDNFKKHNVKLASDISHLTEKKSVFITMLPDGKALQKLVLGKNGLINSVKKNSIFIDCSSVDYGTTVRVSKALNSAGVKFLDAPVSGGVVGAVNASLTIMVGGNINGYRKVKKILSCMGKKVIHVGNSGAGQIVKACNNMMLGINMIGVCEAFLLAKKFGINQKKFFEITSISSGSSWAMLNHLPFKGIINSTAANNKFKPGYAAKLILKDLNISQEMSKKINFNTILGKKALELYKIFCNQDKKNLDYAAIIKIFDR